MAVRLGRFGARLPRENQSASLAFTLLGVYLAFAVSLATVYLGLQTIPLLLMVTGWSEGLMMAPVAVAEQLPAWIPVMRFRYERVMV